MNWNTIYGKIAALALIIALATGCQGAQPSLEPTIDNQPTFAAIQTQAVQTAIAQMTLSAPTGAPALPTVAVVDQVPTEAAATEVPTIEPSPLPSATPLPPTAIPTNTFVPWTATPARTATSSSYNCSITESSPAFGYEIRAGGDFDGKWVVKNTGDQTWSTSEVDVKFLSGTKFQADDVDAMDLSTSVAKGKSITIIIDMLAPNSSGRYSTVWGIVRGGQTICALPITINVP